jgi:hypothetical protein
MSNAWDTARQLAEKHAAAGGIFVRLQNDGDKVVGVFCGEPFAKEVYWDGQKYITTPPEGGGPKPSLRVSLNFYVPADGAMKVIEGGTAWFRDVLTVKDKYSLDKFSYEITRRGKKGDPKTKYSILPDTPVDDAMRARIAAASLHELSALGSGTEDAGDAEAPKTIDLETARQIVDRLKPLSREVAHAFLSEMRVERIRDLLSADLPRALRFIESREQPAPTDPFGI